MMRFEVKDFQSNITQEARRDMLPLMEVAGYVRARIVGRITKGRRPDGGSWPRHVDKVGRDGKVRRITLPRARDFHETGHLLKNWRVKGQSPTRVSIVFLGKHPTRQRLAKDSKRGSKKERAAGMRRLPNRELAAILNSDLPMDFHALSRQEIADVQTVITGKIAGAVLRRMRTHEQEFQMERRARAALRRAKAARRDRGIIGRP